MLITYLIYYTIIYFQFFQMETFNFQDFNWKFGNSELKFED